MIETPLKPIFHSKQPIFHSKRPIFVRFPQRPPLVRFSSNFASSASKFCPFLPHLRSNFVLFFCFKDRRWKDLRNVLPRYSHEAHRGTFPTPLTRPPLPTRPLTRPTTPTSIPPCFDRPPRRLNREMPLLRLQLRQSARPRWTSAPTPATPSRHPQRHLTFIRSPGTGLTHISTVPPNDSNAQRLGATLFECQGGAVISAPASMRCHTQRLTCLAATKNRARQWS